ncbi:unnamed protein product [Cladocopium goreaui]|uniref:Eukaryotic translation initiation factor 5B n=1 Tax=Cladocopium goreaui TaxID=2562237 RepID=A0A9P1GPK1_9DINO|nr:unnamed protein product [Cladocopium goreaui]|mmetsp:Transcript_1144/g.2527  ORF Transcript_1144/g.2527 Transcript_1144/m.2527 type:complete len:1244 (+) Transcript_1144:134-3865(+)
MPSKKKQEVETPEPDEAENSASESEPETKKPVKKSAFAMMMDSDDDDEDEEEKSSPSPKKSESGKKKKEDVSEEIAMFGEKKKKKKKEATDEKEEKDGKKEKKDKKEKKEGKEKKKRGPTVCEVTEVSAVPKKDKLKLCKVAIIVGMDPVEIVTSAPNVTAGHKFIAAPPGYTTANGIEVKVAKVGGIESAGMFCGPKEMGWDTDILDGDLAIMLADSAEVGSPAPPYEEAVAAFQQREKEAKQKQEEEAKAAAAASAKDDKKGKKKKGKAAKEADEDLDELLAEFKEDAPAEPAEKPQEESVPTEAAGVAAGAGGAAGKSASQKKKDKKKGNKGTTDAADDDFDAALEEYKPEPADAAQPEDQDDNKAEDEGLDAKTLANRKKKEKKKAKQQEKTGGEGLWATAPEEEQGESKEPAAASSSKDEAPAAAAKKGAKKESAIVKAARERLEQEQKLAEEKRAFEEAERQRVEEEQRQIEEEERKKEEERQRKRDHKAAKIAKQKAEGTYLTKKQKEQAKRAAQLREQFGYNMGKDEDEEAEEEAEKPQKRPMATKKKKRPQRMQETEETAEKETEKLEEETKPEPEVEKPTPVEETKEEEDDDDDWEKKLEEEAEEKSPKAAEAEAAESDDDKDSDSDSDSDSSSSSSSSITPLRSPVICIMGHVDTGKTKLLDKIRRTNVQEGEAGGITQQIGATFFPDIALQEQTKKVDEDFDLEVPGVLIIDTPGHESFNNLRMRGSSLADLAILVIDIMHGLEPQTVESLELLKKRKCPFIIALNKIDILYKWNSKTYTGIQDALGRQEDSVREEFRTRFNNVVLQLNERGLNCNLYWENPDYRTAVSIVPTSALTGEGVPDLLYMILKLTQDLMVDKLEVREELECTVIEVKNIEGLGTTIDVVLLNGTLKEGDTIVLAGIGGPIVTTIRALLTPQPMKEMRVKNEYVHHAQISTSMGVKISAPGLEDAVAGTELLVLGPDDDLEELKEDVSEGFESILNDFEKEPAGVYVKASTLGSLEALLSFLQDMKIPVFDVGIGEVHKRDVKKACIMKEKKHPEYALILAFDVKVNQEAQKQADTDGVTIFTADIIYHLQDKFTKYMEKFRESQKTESKKVAVFPVVLSIDKQHIFRKQDPIILGCQVVGGQLRTGTPICIPDKQNLVIGHVAGIENNKKTVQLARRGDTVCVKIEQTTAQNHIMYGRHFDHNNQLYSQISRQSIDTLKEHFKDEMKKEDWELIIGMKKVFEIQ